MLYKNLSADELKNIETIQKKKMETYKSRGYNLNMARGKLSQEQLELSMPILKCLDENNIKETKNGIDVRNYGGNRGIDEARQFFADILSVDKDMVIVLDNSSLSLMYDCISFSYQFGLFGSQPWYKEKTKFLCPVPGYDRHFSICELFGIEMIPIETDRNGPDMEKVKAYVETDPQIKGIFCVPKYSNPSGITYSRQTVTDFAALTPAAPDFRIYWDNAYIVHGFKEKKDNLLNIFDACCEHNSADMVLEFASTSKITFPGAGISCIASTKSNLDQIIKFMSYRKIGPNKVNQLRHCLFLNSVDKLKQHMEKHAEILRPRFEFIADVLQREIEPLGIGRFTNPNGGYFISFNSINGCAKRIVSLCKEAGLTLTDAGATYPYKNDPHDSNIRIAPTYPAFDELKLSMEIFVAAVKLASAQKLLENNKL